MNNLEIFYNFIKDYKANPEFVNDTNILYFHIQDGMNLELKKSILILLPLCFDNLYICSEKIHAKSMSFNILSRESINSGKELLMEFFSLSMEELLHVFIPFQQKQKYGYTQLNAVYSLRQFQEHLKIFINTQNKKNGKPTIGNTNKFGFATE